MKIAELVSPERAVVGYRSTDKQALLQDLSAEAARSLGLPADAIAQQLLRREELGSTGIGDGVAIPHARLDALKAPYGAVARLKRPIEFEAVDGKPVDVIVLLLLPSAVADDPLNALACVARTLRTPGRADRLRKARDSVELYQELIR
jgi:nitrogen PTS system EIIA component